MVTRSAPGSVPGIGGFTRLQPRLPPLLRTFIIKADSIDLASTCKVSFCGRQLAVTKLTSAKMNILILLGKFSFIAFTNRN